MPIIHAAKTPGPPAYKQKDLCGSDGRSHWSFGYWRDVPPQTNTKTPGPGTYDESQGKKTGKDGGVKYSFRARLKTLPPTSVYAPGPGNYSPKNPILPDTSNIVTRPTSSNWGRSHRFSPENARFSFPRRSRADITQERMQRHRELVLKNLTNAPLTRTSAMMGPGKYTGHTSKLTDSYSYRQAPLPSFAKKTACNDSQYASTVNSKRVLSHTFPEVPKARQRQILH